MSLRAIVGRDTAPPHLGAFFMLARSIAAGAGNPGAALRYAEQHKANGDVVDCLKTAVAAGSTDVAAWAGSLTQYNILVQAFADSLKSWSAFDAVLPFCNRVPLKSKLVIMTTDPSASRIGEMNQKPLSKAVFALSDAIEPWKSAAIIAVSDELLKHAEPGTAELFSAKLSQAVAEGADTTFLQGLIDSTTPSGSAGSTADNVLTDLGTLVNAVTTGSNSKLFFIAESSNVKKMVLKRTTGGSPLFPGLQISGGTLGGGITCVVSDQLPSGYAVMCDAQGIAASSGAITLDSSNQTSLQFSSTPDSPATTSTVWQNLFQSNLIALRAERFFGFSVLRSSAVASLSSVSY